MTAVAPHRPGPARTVLATIAMVLCGVLVVASVGAAWTRSAILDDATWRATSRAIVTDPGAQEEVANDIAAQIVSVVGVQAFLGQVLPGGLSALSGTATQLATDALAKVVQQVVTTDVFLSVWDAAVEAAHTQFVDAVTGRDGVTVVGSGGVYLDLGAVVGVVQKFLSSKGIDWLKGIDANAIDVRVLLVEAPGLQRAKDLVDVLDVLVRVLPIAAIVLAIGGLLIARRRLLAVAAAGAGMVVGAIALWVLARVGRTIAVDELTGGLLGRATATVIVDEVTRTLDRRMLVVGLVGLVMTIALVVVAVVRGRASGSDDSTPSVDSPPSDAAEATGTGFSATMPASPPTLPPA